jgi:hypothetical protein
MLRNTPFSVVKTNFVRGLTGALLAVSMLQAQIVTPTLKEVMRRTSYVYDPTWMQAEDNHRLLITDAVNPSYALYRYDLSKDRILHSRRVGNGPGELAPMGMKWVSRLRNGDLWVYDAGAFKAYRFAPDLSNPVIQRLPSGATRSLSIHLLSDTLLVVVPMNQTEVVRYYTTQAPGKPTLSPLNAIRVSDYPEFKSLSNFLLKNGHAVSSSNQLFFTYLYAPYLLKLDEKGVTWMSGHELGRGFPPQKRSGNEVRMPDAGEHPQQTLSVTANKRYVFVLHNGETIGFWRTLTASITRDYAEIDQVVNASDRIRIYDAGTGRFLQEWKLPLRARLISVYDRYLYVYAQIEGIPTIITYQWS